MKKLYIPGVILLIIILVYVGLVNKSKSYEIEYQYNNYKVEEKYNKTVNAYIFTILYNNLKYDFIIEHDYSNKRKVIDKIDEVDKDNKCLQISAFDVKSSIICNNGEFYIKKSDEKENDKIKEYDNVSIYKKGNYYIWNKYGITSLNKEKKYKFLKTETYDNKLYYVLDNYLVFADYDQIRVFNKLYIFNTVKEKLNEFNLPYDISFDSYFMGDMDGYIYLYDQKNQVQYKINIDKKKISIVSDKNGGVTFDKEWVNVSYNKLNYNEIKFNYNNLYNYFVKDNKLYLKFIDSEDDILISDKKVQDIIKVSNNKVYYLADSSVYMYELNKSHELVMTNFEWNFSYIGKIFIID